MSMHRVYLGQLTITSGTKPSTAVLNPQELGMARAICIYGPATLTGAVSIMVGPKDSTVIGSHVPLKINGTAAVVAAATANVWEWPGGGSLSLNSASNEGADRVFECYAMFDLAD